MEEKRDIFAELAAPFTAKDGNPSHKWKPQTVNNNFAMCVPYIDARQVTSRLNEVLGVDGWGNTLAETSGSGMICELTIYLADKEISKSDIGVPSEYAKEKGSASDALKRAAVHFGVGAYIYAMEPVKLKSGVLNNKKYACTDDGEILETADALTSYINLMHPLRAKWIEIYNSISPDNQTRLEAQFTQIWNAISK